MPIFRSSKPTATHLPLMPKQETGIKHSYALPYELYADGSLERG
jgi:hypothetical protein